MSVTRVLATTGAALAMVAASMPVALGEPAGIGGQFGGEILYEGEQASCQAAAAEHEVAGGTWRINVHDTKGTARFVIFVDGQPHVAYTAQLARTDNPTATFEGSVQTGAGKLTVTVQGNEMTYQIAPYDFTAWGGSKCDAAIYHGTVTTN